MPAPSWPGLYKWAARYSDGTESSSAASISEEDRQWLVAAMQEGMVDNTETMKAIKHFLDSGTADEEAVAQKKSLLEELTEIVENVDNARDLNRIGGIRTLKSLMESPYAGLRWRAAEVVGMAAQSHEPVQQQFLDDNILPSLLTLLVDVDSKCRTKALLAISCLIRHNQSGIAAFHAADGLQRLAAVVSQNAPEAQQAAHAPSTSPHSAAAPPTSHRQTEQGQTDLRQLRKALQLLTYLADHDDARQWALSLLAAAARSSSGMRQLHKEEGLSEQLQQRQAQLSVLDVEDLAPLKEENSLVEGLVASLRESAVNNCRVQRQDDRPQATASTSLQLSVASS
ncbi:hypothetical protein WJX73_001929 [Symbiochloris irregularis]|uniref:Nucleotide exchange factor Fes1 domain-containing protein n=1 Tax=Symbiochloris irregularis TaxID=706552 RepID=A0AAW1PDN8_9CHLO